MAMFDDLKNGLKEVDAYLGGKHAGYKVTIPAQIDVKNIRKGLHMTQAGFSHIFGFSLMLSSIGREEDGLQRPPLVHFSP